MESLEPYLERKRDAMQALRVTWGDARAAGDEDAGFVTVRAGSTLAGVTGARVVQAGAHRLVTDSAQALAGHALGPTAPELLLGALASCLVHTYVIQAVLLEVPLEGVEVEMAARLDMAATLGQGGPPPRLEQVTYAAHVQSPASEEAIGWLHAAVEANCPVLNTVKQPVDVRRVTALADAERATRPAEESTAMLLKTIYDSALAQASYLLGCQATGTAVVVDPARDIAPYLALAAKEGLRITHVTETHIHADFVSGVRELAAATGAQKMLSGMGGPDWHYGYADEQTTLLADGDTWMVGNIRLEALHTPGHTPEHLCFLFTDTKAADRPMGILSGDCLFVGDIGRPDLLETAAGVVGSAAVGAREQFYSVQRLAQLPDYLMVLPGHGAGSACGKALGAVPSSTLGYEKLFSPGFQFDDAESFSRWLLSDQPETPPYFAQMKRVNKIGPAYLKDLLAPEPLDGFILADALRNGLVIDARSADQYDEAHIPGSISIPVTDKFSTYAGWFVHYEQPTFLICHAEQAPDLERRLRAIGVDDLPGYFPDEQVEGTSEALPTVDLDQAEQLIRDGALVIDVRALSEYREDHLYGARHLFYGHIPARLHTVPQDQPVLLYCASGVRTQIASSLFERAGYDNVLRLRGGIEAWKAAGLPVETGALPV